MNLTAILKKYDKALMLLAGAGTSHLFSQIAEKEKVLDSVNKKYSQTEGILSQMNSGSEKYVVRDIVQILQSALKNIKDLFEDGDKSNYIPDFNNFLNKYYAYLDTLTLLEEVAFFHILIFLLILIAIFNILGVLFGNEIIKSFDLENKFPSLNKFFKLRNQMQKYYLMWNVFILFGSCIFCLTINIYILY